MLKPSDLDACDMKVIASMIHSGVRFNASAINMNGKTERDLESSFEITMKAIKKAMKK